MRLADFLVYEAIITDLRATTKEGVIREILGRLRDTGHLKQAHVEAIARVDLSRGAQFDGDRRGGGLPRDEARRGRSRDRDRRPVAAGGRLRRVRRRSGRRLLPGALAGDQARGPSAG